MSLPLVIIFERHWDEIPKYLVKSLVPGLTAEGYNTLCLEAPQNVSSEELRYRAAHGVELGSGILSDAEKYLGRARIKTDCKLSDMSYGKLSALMMNYVSSKGYLGVAERIKQLPAALLFSEILCDANKHSLFIQGIDVPKVDCPLQNIWSPSERMSVVRKFDDVRTAAFVENLLELRRKRSGVFFSCGVFHAKKLIEGLKQRGLGEEDIVYYFPHSSKRYDEDFDCIGDAVKSQGIESHAVYLSAGAEIEAFAKKIITEIKCKNRRFTAEVPGGTSLSCLLSELFHAQFKALRRPGYWVDAVLDAEQSVDVQSIADKLAQAGIQTSYGVLQQHKTLIVPEINVPEVANKIRALVKE